MRKFHLNDRDIDLANAKSIMGVRPCFTDVEPGVHLDGYGYAVYGKLVHQILTPLFILWLNPCSACVGSRSTNVQDLITVVHN